MNRKTSPRRTFPPPSRALGLVLALAANAPAQAAAQTTPADGGWPVYGGSAAHTRYSPLDGIDASNVGELEIAWRWSSAAFGPRPEIKGETTPILVDGVLYATAGAHRAVVALDPGTGKTIWTWNADEGDRLEKAPRPNSGRGVAFWRDGEGVGRVLVITPGYHLVALDAATGLPVSGFGQGGVVDLMEEHRTRPGVDMVGSTGASSPPLVAGNVIVVGSAHHVGMRPPSYVNTPGDVRGYDARTGRLLWTFHTIPEPGEPGNESWLDDSWSYTGNAAVWAPMSYDPETDLAYLPVESATGDYYGGHRPGANLYSSSLVALRASTGERVWHQQLVHHDIWDWDTPTAPILADITIEAVPRKVVVQLTKQAFAYVFDRITGEPVWPMEERPVPQTDVPHEWTSPTQPFPTRPAPFDRQGVSPDDLLDFTPEVRARALELARPYRMGPLFTPPSLADAPDGTEGTLSLPGSLGGANWEAGALDPETGLLYVGSATNPALLALVHDEEASDMHYIQAGRAPQFAPGVPLVKPPWGRITAIDLTTGEHVWMMANGDTPAYVGEALGVDPASLPRTGRPTRAGLLATATLLFAGEGYGGDPVLRAHAKDTGVIVAEIALPAAQSGLPMTYLHDGKQYVVVTVGGYESPVEIVALALPPETGHPVSRVARTGGSATLLLKKSTSPLHR
ncbi:MAG: PQQ-binding-like beta-propeller repeat protein [Gemmatimonadota bacterium]|nr:PQQ-binding-like beta-propeller repeat protein [Gemmatimonadota bacterium]MDH5760320.1 PQQ-binding-like beta-propeller repeat protein [Gemmatimonadota bacterium]